MRRQLTARLVMKNEINIEAAKISVLSSGKIYKYEYHRGKEILPPDQSRVIEQTNFTYFPLRIYYRNRNRIITL